MYGIRGPILIYRSSLRICWFEHMGTNSIFCVYMWFVNSITKTNHQAQRFTQVTQTQYLNLLLICDLIDVHYKSIGTVANINIAIYIYISMSWLYCQAWLSMKALLHQSLLPPTRLFQFKYLNSWPSRLNYEISFRNSANKHQNNPRANA